MSFIFSDDISWSGAEFGLVELTLKLFLLLVNVECGRAGGLRLSHLIHKLLNLLSDLHILLVEHVLIE